MTFLADLLANTLGAEPTDRNLWLATQEKNSAIRIAGDLLAQYQQSDAIFTPAKQMGEFRPAFLTDYHGRSVTPYDREFSFVARALCYADSVAVIDPIHAWDLAEDPEEIFLNLQLEGYPHCNDLLWTFRRLGRYAQLERAGLLHYVHPPARPVGNLEIDDHTASSLADVVAKHQGWATASKTAMLPRIKQELSLWMTEFQVIMDYVSENSDVVDPYLPQWFAGPDLLEWTFTQAPRPEWLQHPQARDHGSLTRLFSLPAPAGSVAEALSAGEILDIRRADLLEKWRETFSQELRVLHQEPSLEQVDRFTAATQSSANRLCRSIDHTPKLSAALKDVAHTGMTVTPAAMLTGQGPLSATATALAPLLPPLAGATWRWLRGPSGSSTHDAFEPADKDQALKLFMSTPHDAAGGNNQQPPTSWMRTLDGRPIAFDPWG